jgi:hypothetical protein
MDVILVRRCFISVMSTTCILHMQWYAGSPHSLRILVSLLRLVCLLLPPGVSRMLCNHLLRVWILFFHRRTRSVYGMVRLAYHMVKGCILKVLLAGTFCCSRSLLFHSCGIPGFCDHFLDNYCLCIPRLLGCGSRGCRNCEIFSFGHRICFLYRLLVIMFICCCTCLRHLQICLLYPLDLILFSA